MASENSTIASVALAPVPQAISIPGYMTYLNFGQNLAILLFQLVTVPLDANLILNSLFYAHRLSLSGSGLSHSMLALIVVHMLYSVSMMPYQVYSVLWWRTTAGQKYSLNALYWTGVTLSAYLVVPDVAVLFLAVDRLLMLSMRNMYTKKIRLWMMLMEMVALLVVTDYSGLGSHSRPIWWYRM